MVNFCSSGESASIVVKHTRMAIVVNIMMKNVTTK